MQHDSYLLAWLSTFMSCSGLRGLLCHSGVLGSSGGCVGAAASPWPPLGAPGLSCQVSPSFVTTFFSSKAAEVLRKEECHNGADVVGLVLGHSLARPCHLSRTRRAPLWGGGWDREEPGMAPMSSEGPQNRYSLPTGKGPVCKSM